MMRSLKNLAKLNGRIALVTGGAGHIGGAVAQTLLELGAKVGILDIDPQACARRARKLSQGKGRHAFSVPCDLSCEAQTREAVRDTIKAEGGLDILVHCAGFTGESSYPGWAVPFKKQTAGAFEAALKVNLVSAFILAQEARSALSRSGRGAIIFFASIYGVTGAEPSLYAGTRMANPVGYGASKGGLIQMVRYLAKEMAPKVRVNAVSPGGIYRGHGASFLKRYCAKTPLGRMGTEEDMKGAVAYLASDLSAYVTGQNIIVDGGWTA